MTLNKTDQKIYWIFKCPRETKPKSSAQNSLGGSGKLKKKEEEKAHQTTHKTSLSIVLKWSGSPIWNQLPCDGETDVLSRLLCDQVGQEEGQGQLLKHAEPCTEMRKGKGR